MESKELNAMKQEPPYITPEMVTVKIEPNEPITAELGLSCDPLDTDTVIKNEPITTQETVNITIEPAIESLLLDSTTVKQEPCDEEGFYTNHSLHTNSFRERPHANSNTKYELIHADPKFPSTTTSGKMEQLVMETQESNVNDDLYKSYSKNKHSRRYACDICKKRFRSKDNFYNHKTTHTGKTLICDICQKEFLKKSMLSRHIRVHTKEKPFKCKTCLKKFSLQYNLIRHEQIHLGLNHKKTPTSKKQICNICQKEFVKKSILIRHIRVHTQEKPFKCKTCRKKFSQQYNLIRHEQIHLGVKLHSCQICKKHFANAGYLKLHVRVHTREKPYSCDVCKKAFPYLGSLKRHRLTQHKIE